jgi:uncharacterized Zn-binding protein involved in type VI secretion
MPIAATKSMSIAGGPVMEGTERVKIEGMAAAREGDPIQAHGKSPHAKVTIATGSDKVTIDGKPAARAGDPATCGHELTGGAVRVNIG